MRPSSSNSCQALGTELWFGIVIIRIQRPSKRKQDPRRFRRYKRRWKVDRLFGWLKQFRRIAMRWERKAENYLGFLYLGCIVIMLRSL